MKRVEITQLIWADSPRLAGVDEGHVQALVESDGDFPPILVHSATMRVIDGMHRLRCCEVKGESTILARFFDGSEEAAFVAAVETNIAHGLPLTLADRRAAADRILQMQPQLSDRAIAESTALSAKTVASLRQSTTEDKQQLHARVGRDGRMRPISTAEGRQLASEILADRPEASLREIAREAGISVGTARDVRERVRKALDPVPRNQRVAARSTPAEAARDAGSARRADTVDSAEVLARLKRDPSLRHATSGRSLIRWFDRYSLMADDWLAIVGDVPPHAAILLSKLARQCAAEWTSLAGELDRRTEEGHITSNDRPFH